MKGRKGRVVVLWSTLLLPLMILFSGCVRGGSSGDREAVCEAAGVISPAQRPVLAVVPVLKKEAGPFSWGGEEELTHQMFSALSRGSCFRFVPQREVEEIVSTLTPEQDPFGLNCQWVKDKFPFCEFVIFAELLDHALYPKGGAEDGLGSCSPHHLSIVVRLRVFGLCFQQPEVILQEVIHRSVPVSRYLAQKLNQAPEMWEPRMRFSIGSAYAQMGQQMGQHIRKYVLLSVSPQE